MRLKRSSKRHRKKACTGKVKHRTFEAALIACKEHWRLFEKDTPDNFRVYKCKYCGFWHNGHYHRR